AIALENAAARRDDEHARQVGHALVPVEGLLGQERRAMLDPGQDRAPVAALEAEGEMRALARRPRAALARLILVGGQLAGVAERRHARAGPAGLTSRSKSTPWRTSSTRAGMPSPVLQLVNTNGRAPRISRESSSMTARLAPTYGARSVLLMT